MGHVTYECYVSRMTEMMGYVTYEVMHDTHEVMHVTYNTHMTRHVTYE